MARFVYDYALGWKRLYEGLLLETGRWLCGVVCLWWTMAVCVCFWWVMHLPHYSIGCKRRVCGFYLCEPSCGNIAAKYIEENLVDLGSRSRRFSAIFGCDIFWWHCVDVVWRHKQKYRMKYRYKKLLTERVSQNTLCLSKFRRYNDRLNAPPKGELAADKRSAVRAK
jgi:hypothetical protein